MARYKSRPARWADALSTAREALSDVAEAQSKLESAFSELADIQSEYSDWLDGLADVARGTTTEELLQAVVDLDLEPDTEMDTSEIESLLDELESTDLPRGFGRD